MTQINFANPDNIEFKKYYDLNDWGFDFTQSEASLPNKEVLEEIGRDFAKEFGLAPAIVNETFKVEYVTLRTTENILILYTEKGGDDVTRLYVIPILHISGNFLDCSFIIQP